MKFTIELPRGYPERYRKMCKECGIKPNEYLRDIVVSAVDAFEKGLVDGEKAGEGKAGGEPESVNDSGGK